MKHHKKLYIGEIQSGSQASCIWLFRHLSIVASVISIHTSPVKQIAKWQDTTICKNGPSTHISSSLTLTDHDFIKISDSTQFQHR